MGLPRACCARKCNADRGKRGKAELECGIGRTFQSSRIGIDWFGPTVVGGLAQLLLRRRFNSIFRSSLSNSLSADAICSNASRVPYGQAVTSSGRIAHIEARALSGNVAKILSPGLSTFGLQKYRTVISSPVANSFQTRRCGGSFCRRAILCLAALDRDRLRVLAWD